MVTDLISYAIFIVTVGRGVHYYTEMSSVGAGFHFNNAEATPESIEWQDYLIKQVESGVRPT